MATILLVEDNPDDVELTLRALRNHRVSADVQVARDGAEALSYLLDLGSLPPDLVLLDLNLPKISGLEVLARIRENLSIRSLPVVVLSTSSEERDIAAAYRLGANSYIRKPVGFEDFVTTIHSVADYWLSLNVPAPRPD